ncbi:4Fe-4S dicluster domain-containing protein [Desulfoplanes formicivorans]|uniref:Iron-sulfur cluster binding protein n=1 Tax=Desulfoplanes formicivorans TaxID=1592317 RepID=A0A194ALI8_9BACT|nr:ferredoxin family protein [Desulfoplanes formicivorans]GAU09891.1 iron-sulfur cluster binding protein [Desulfoplanes formicivorans]
MTIQSIKGCIGCGTCVSTCPTDVIRQNSQTGKAFIKYSADCQLCHLCQMYCPVDAITINPDKSIPVIVAWG